MTNNVTHNSATCGGNVTDEGSESVTARGVCWSTNANPTLADNYTTDGSGMGSSSSSEANPSGVQGICPNGWHVPSEGEWNQLINYVKSQSEYICSGGDNSWIGKALASTADWQNSSSSTCAVGNNPSDNNATGFSALPISYDTYNNWEDAIFWSATESYPTMSYILKTCSNDAVVTMPFFPKYSSQSVRCVRN